jgi:hypothetical protein
MKGVCFDEDAEVGGRGGEGERGVVCGFERAGGGSAGCGGAGGGEEAFADTQHSTKAGAKLNAEAVGAGLRGLKDCPLAGDLAESAATRP